ncbi:hypothetical protein [Streptomyces sp. NBC_00467]|uniref:hypothetical protein n=1 Tax=Streptomyces sp. NBC_00467 TaxID=2975752 RepID=UPI002E16FBB0
MDEELDISQMNLLNPGPRSGQPPHRLPYRLVRLHPEIPHCWRLDLDPAPRLSLGHLQTDGTHWGNVVQAGETTCLADPLPSTSTSRVWSGVSAGTEAGENTPCGRVLLLLTGRGARRVVSRPLGGVDAVELVLLADVLGVLSGGE